MKMLFIIIATTILLKPAFPVLEYLVNYDYIATELCINKDKPEMHCNGKCHLAKEIAKTINTESSNPTEKKANTLQFEILYFQEIHSITFNGTTFSSHPKETTVYTNIYQHLFSNATFRPPTVIIG